MHKKIILLYFLVLSPYILSSDQTHSTSKHWHSPQMHRQLHINYKLSSIAHDTKEDKKLSDDETSSYIEKMDSKSGHAFLNQISKIERARLYPVFLHYNKEDVINQHLNKKTALELLTKPLTTPASNNSEDLCDAAYIYEADGKMNEAIRCYEFSKTADGLYQAGRILYEQNNRIRAIPLFEQASKKDSLSAHKALAYLKTEEYGQYDRLSEEEKNCFESVLRYTKKMDPDPLAQTWADRVSFQRARLLEKSGNYKQAVELFTVTALNTEFKQESLIHIARIQERLDTTDVISAYTTILEHDPEDSFSLYQRALLTAPTDPKSSTQDALRLIACINDNCTSTTMPNLNNLAQLFLQLETDDASIYKQLIAGSKSSSPTGEKTRKVLYLLGQTPFDVIQSTKQLQEMIKSKYTSENTKKTYCRRLLKKYIEQNTLSQDEAENAIILLTALNQEDDKITLKKQLFDRHGTAFTVPTHIKITLKALRYLIREDNPDLPLIRHLYDDFIKQCHNTNNTTLIQTALNQLLQDTLLSEMERKSTDPAIRQMLGTIYADIGTYCKSEKVLEKACSILDPMDKETTTEPITQDAAPVAARAHATLAEIYGENSTLKAYEHSARAATLQPEYQWSHGAFIKKYLDNIINQHQSYNKSILTNEISRVWTDYIDHYQGNVPAERLFNIMTHFKDQCLERAKEGSRDDYLIKMKECADLLLRQADQERSLLENTLSEGTITKTDFEPRIHSLEEKIGAAHIVLGKYYCNNKNKSVNITRALSHFDLAEQHVPFAMLLAGICLHDNGSYDLAHEKLKEFIASDCTNRTFIKTAQWYLAAIEMRRHNFDQAIEELRAIENGTTNDAIIDTESYIPVEIMPIMQQKTAEILKKNMADITTGDIDLCRIFGLIILTECNNQHLRSFIADALRSLDFCSRAGDPKSTLSLLNHANQHNNDTLKEKYLERLIENLHQIAAGTSLAMRGKSLVTIMQSIEPTIRSMLNIRHPDTQKSIFGFGIMSVIIPLYKENIDTLFEIMKDSNYLECLGTDETVSDEYLTKLNSCISLIEAYQLEQLRDNSATSAKKYIDALTISTFIRYMIINTNIVEKSAKVGMFSGNSVDLQRQIQTLIDILDSASLKVTLPDNLIKIYCNACLYLMDLFHLDKNISEAKKYCHKAQKIARNNPSAFPAHIITIKELSIDPAMEEKKINKLLAALSPEIKESIYYPYLITALIILNGEEKYSFIRDCINKIETNHLLKQQIHEATVSAENLIKKAKTTKNEQERKAIAKALETKKIVIGQAISLLSL